MQIESGQDLIESYRALLERTPVGSIAKGEIRIIVDPDEAETVRRAILDGATITHGQLGELTAGIVYRDRYIMVVRDLVQFPRGEFGTYIRILPATTDYFGVCVLPLVGNKFVLIRQFRHATRRWHFELVKGFADQAEASDDGARRELMEELGANANDLERLGVVFADVGLLGSRVEVFAAHIDLQKKLGVGDYGSATVDLYSWDELMTLVKAGQIDDALTLASLQLYGTQQQNKSIFISES